jgi:hypothetical protein
MRTVSSLLLLLLLVAAATAQDRLISPYQPQAQFGLRGLNENEIAELRAGAGMGLARAAELNSYPGPRHVLDAVAAGRFPASPDQIQRVQLIFAGMKGDAQRLGAEILKEEARLEAAFRTRTITDHDLRVQVTRIAALQGELRAAHLRAHLATSAILSAAQLAHYNELRGYTTGSADHPGQPHAH